MNNIKEKLITMFIEIYKISNVSINSISNKYILYKFLELLNCENELKLFSFRICGYILDYDNKWRIVCSELNWPLIPIVDIKNHFLVIFMICLLKINIY